MVSRFVFMLAILCIIPNTAFAQQIFSDEWAVGSWFGKALPTDPATAPFPEVVMTPTFLADGNVLANDSHELTNPHVTSHGNWFPIGHDRISATFIWMNLTEDGETTPSGFTGTFKVRLVGHVDPNNPDQMTGTVSPVLFPPGTDPLDPNDTGGTPVGTFIIEELGRIKADPSIQTTINRDLSGELAVGSWFGRALPNDPETAPFPEVVMTPTFMSDGNVIANDSHELTNPHVTSHGDWVVTGENQMQATFIWMNLTEDGATTPSGFAGTFKVRLVGQVDPNNPDQMTGTVSPVLFPPGTDPLDPNDTGGTPVGTFTIEDLKRIKADPTLQTDTDRDLSSELATGSWFGRAVPNDPETAPFPEVVMTPTFLADGNVIANDSHELTNPHVTSHGDWVVTGENQMQATFIWMNLTDDGENTPSGFTGTFKVRLVGQVDPNNPDQMTGTVSPVLFPPGTDPLDPDDTGGTPAGTFTIEDLKRIKTVTPPAQVQFNTAFARPNGQAVVRVGLQTPLPAAGLQLKVQPVDSGETGDREPHDSGSSHARFIGAVNHLESLGFTLAEGTDAAGVTTILLFHPGGDNLPPNAVDRTVLELIYDIDGDTPHGQEIDLDAWDVVLSDPDNAALGLNVQEGSIRIGVPGDVAGGPLNDGDGNVNILDIVKTIRYILGVLPTPQGFALFVADPVDDGVINIQDLVWMINTLTNPSANAKAVLDMPTQPATVSLDAIQKNDNGQWVIPVVLSANGTIAGLQATLRFNAAQLEAGRPYLTDRAAGLMLEHRISDNGEVHLVVYSTTGDVIPPGTGVALYLPISVLTNSSSSVVSLTEVTLADRQAGSIPAILGETTASLKSVPSSFALKDNAPNPFNPSTAIAYEVPRQAHITLTIYNLLGQEVIRLVDQIQTPGSYTAVWQGRNANGAGVASGIYMYRLSTSTGFSETRRMTLLK